MATVFDCIRKVDLCCKFRAHAFYTMACIFTDVATLIGTPTPTSQPSNTEDQEQPAFRAFLDKIWHSVDVHAVSIYTDSEHNPLLLASLLRLTTMATPTTLTYIPSNAFVEHLLLSFDSFRCGGEHPSVPIQAEAVALLAKLPAIIYKRRAHAICLTVAELLIKHTYAATGLESAGNLIATSVSVPVHSYSLYTLSLLLVPIRILCEEYPAVCVEVGLDVVLLHALQWAIAATMGDGWPGLEVRVEGGYASDSPTYSAITTTDTISTSAASITPSLPSPTSSNIARTLKTLLSTLAIADCTRDPDTGIMRWLLLLRTVARGMGGIDEEDDEKSGIGGTGTDAANTEAPTDTSTAITSYQSLIAHSKAVANQRIAQLLNMIGMRGMDGCMMPCGVGSSSSLNGAGGVNTGIGILAPSVAIRTFALSLSARVLALTPASIGMGGTSTGTGTSTPHTDMHMARQLTNQYLSTHPYPTSPLYLSLYLHDLLTTAVACSTYSINDVTVVGMQTEGVRLLLGICELFSATPDPEEVDLERAGAGIGKSMGTGSGGSPGLVLSQYLSQVQSGFRSGIGGTGKSGSPPLTLRSLSCQLFCVLLEAGLLQDVVVMRRLVTHIVTSLRQGSVSEHTEKHTENRVSHSGKPDQVQTNDSNRAAPCQLNEIDASCDRYTTLYTIARLYVLHTGTGTCESVREAIGGMLGPVLSTTVPVWQAMCIDAARCLQGGEEGFW